MFSDQKTYLQMCLVASDIICLLILYLVFVPFLSGAITGHVPFFSDLVPKSDVFYKSGLYFKFLPVMIFLPVAVFVPFGYQRIRIKRFEFVWFHTFLMSLLVTMCLFFIFRRVDLAASQPIFLAVSSGVLLWGLLIAGRYYLRHLVINTDRNQNLIKHILIIGTCRKARALSGYIRQHPETGLRVVGFLTDGSIENPEIDQVRVLGQVREIADIIQNHYTDCVLYAGSPDYEQHYIFLMTACSIRGIDFATIQSVSQKSANHHIRIFSEELSGISLNVIKFVYQHPVHVFCKRAGDFLASVLLIGLTLPLWAAIGVSIKLTSPGPVFFRQERVGKYGRLFTLYKFRSMQDGAEGMQDQLAHLNEMDGPAFKIEKDPRQTITGRFLRRTSLDELPQLLNVFKGDISLVGPRPAIEKEVCQYHPWERKRLAVVQGITCIWQISGRNTIKFDEWMKLDLMYIENWSMALDYQILFKTVPAVLLKKGAY